MRKFKFLGNPNTYNWDFPLVFKTVYSESIKAMGETTIGDIMDLPQDPNDPAFDDDWEEIQEPLND